MVVSLAKTAEGVRLTIDDDGPGVAESDRERIFEPYVRVEGTPRWSWGGMGLGLVLAANAPAWTAAACIARRRTFRERGSSRTIPARRSDHMPRIPIVEDDKNLAAGLDYNLRRAGYDVRLAADGATGLENAPRELLT